MQFSNVVNVAQMLQVLTEEQIRYPLNNKCEIIFLGLFGGVKFKIMVRITLTGKILQIIEVSDLMIALSRKYGKLFPKMENHKIFKFSIEAKLPRANGFSK